MTTFIIFYIIIGAIFYIVASNTQAFARKGVELFFFGFLLWPVGLLVYAIEMQNQKNERDKKNGSNFH